MISTRWLQQRRPYWVRVDELAARVEKGGIRVLSHHELRELADLTQIPITQTLMGLGAFPAGE